LAVRNKLSTKALSSLTRGREYWRTFFSLQSPHDALDVTAACLLTTAPPLALPESDPWPRVPDGQVKFPHPWPPQIPPGRTAGL
jgi:hypothetical protein